MTTGGSGAASAVACEIVIVSCSMIIHRTPGFQTPSDGPWRDGFDLAAALRVGLVPLVVKAEGLVRRLDDFSRFLEVASFSHAQLLNVAEIARECVASRNTVESYLGILEDLLIATRIPVFRRRAKRAVVAHGKFYFFDCGVFRSLRPAGLLDAGAEIDGAALEGLVLQHLRAWIGYGNADCRVFFWRTRGGSEVDFVLYGGAMDSMPSRSTTAARCGPPTCAASRRSTATTRKRRRCCCTGAARPWSGTGCGACR